MSIVPYSYRHSLKKRFIRRYIQLFLFFETAIFKHDPASWRFDRTSCSPSSVWSIHEWVVFNDFDFTQGVMPHLHFVLPSTPYIDAHMLASSLPAFVLTFLLAVAGVTPRKNTAAEPNYLICSATLAQHLHASVLLSNWGCSMIFESFKQ